MMKLEPMKALEMSAKTKPVELVELMSSNKDDWSHEREVEMEP